MRRELVERDARLTATRRIAARERDERGEVGVPLARLGKQREMGEQRIPVARADGHGELGADETGESRVARGGGEADRAPELVVIGEGERGKSELGRARDEQLRQRGAIEQGEAGMTVQLGVGGHAWRRWYVGAPVRRCVSW